MKANNDYYTIDISDVLERLDQEVDAALKEVFPNNESLRNE